MYACTLPQDPVGMEMTFTADETHFGESREVELKKGGAGIEVRESTPYEIMRFFFNYKTETTAGRNPSTSGISRLGATDNNPMYVDVRADVCADVRAVC